MHSRQSLLCALLAALHFSIDERAWWHGGVFRAVGVNSIVLYVGSEVFATVMDRLYVGTAICSRPGDDGRCSLKDIVNQNAFERTGLSVAGAQALWGMLCTCAWLGAGYALDRRGVHITI